MKITLLENNEKIRRNFIDRFVMSWDEFQVELKAFIDEMSKKNQVVDIEFYNRSYLWDKISSKYSRVSFREALDFLSNIDGDAIFISENEKVPCSAELFIDGNKIRSFAAKSNAKELAKLIEKEWFETYSLEEQGMYNPNPILPEDLYVFESSMSWFVVFTHETTDWETEDSTKEAESRYCIIYSEKISRWSEYMKEIKINIPEYDDCIELVWEKDFKIKTRYEYDTIIIEANKAGLVSLARHLLVLAQEETPSGSHIHLDEFNSLEDSSVELILDKNDDL